MLAITFIILLSCVYICARALSLDYDVFINNYRAITRGTDAPDGSYKHVGRIHFNVTFKNSVITPAGKNVTEIRAQGTGFFVMHKGPNGDKKHFFFTVAHLFNLNFTRIPTGEYIKPGRTTKISLVSLTDAFHNATLQIFYGSVIREDQKEFQIYPNGLYTTPPLGEAHIVRLPSVYTCTNEDLYRQDIDMAAIELTENQADQFVNDGGIFVTSKDDSPEKLFPAGEVCKIGSWGITNENDVGPLNPPKFPARLQQADIMARDLDYCTDSFEDDDPSRNDTNFACFSTHIRSDKDPQIRRGDSGSPITCGTGDGFVATMATHVERFAVFGPTRASIFAFIKDCFYD